MRTGHPLPCSDKPSPPPGHVLIAEDDVEMRRLLGGALRRAGFRVFEAVDGVDLRDRILHADGELPALVISDVRMPRLSGLDAVRAIRERFAALPVIIITAFGDHDTHERAAALGACTVLDKPFDLDDLVAAVRAVLQPA